LLNPHFEAKNIYLNPILIGKSGGDVSFKRLKKDIIILLKDSSAFVTTLIDYYGLSKSFPGKELAIKEKTIREKSKAICDALEHEIERDAQDRSGRFIPYVQMHEYEGLLFSDTTKFARSIGKPELAKQFQEIRDEFTTPEEINDHPNTAPSKRILALARDYEKPTMGALAALEIGLLGIRRECPIFNQWLEQLEKLK
jgi:Domain of unknown function (DUF4276)